MTVNWIPLFFWGYIGVMILLGLKRWIIPLHNALNNLPIGEWAMYRGSLEITKYEVSIETSKRKIKDISDFSKEFLWQDFKEGQFVSISHPDFPHKAFREFPHWLSNLQEVQKITKEHRKKHPKDELLVTIDFRYTEQGVHKKQKASAQIP